MARRRTAEEIKRLLESYGASGMTQAEYSRQADMALSTLGRYLRRNGQRAQRLVRVNVKPAAELDRGFVLVLSNGRRIESGWKFADAELVRVIRIAEAM